MNESDTRGAQQCATKLCGETTPTAPKKRPEGTSVHPRSRAAAAPASPIAYSSGLSPLSLAVQGDFVLRRTLRQLETI
eukprot:2554415-Prymnesium_polylepis.1